MTTYNGEKYLKEQLDSILIQIGDNDEIIISDDGSSDSTLYIIDSYKDPRIKVYKNKQSKQNYKYSFYKITKNFENAISKAKGDIIFLADQDDIWLPEKIEKTLNEFKSKTLLVIHDCKVINEQKKIISESYYTQNNSKKGFFRNLIKSSYLGCCMAFKRELLDKALPYPQNAVPHDIWLGLIAEWNKKVVFSNEKLILYRRHNSNQSTSGSKSNFSLKTKIEYRMILAYFLFRRLVF